MAEFNGMLKRFGQLVNIWDPNKKKKIKKKYWKTEHGVSAIIDHHNPSRYEHTHT